MVRLQKTVTPILLADSLYCLLSSHTLMKPVAMLESPVARKCPWSLTNSKKRPEILNPTTLEEPNLIDNHMSLDAPVEPSDETPA